MNTIHAEPEATSAPASPRIQLKETVEIPIDGVALPAELIVPPGARGLVLFIVANGSIRETPRAALIARAIESKGLATLSFSLLTHTEAQSDSHTGNWSFELDLLTHPAEARVSSLQVGPDQMPALAAGEQATVRVELEGGLLEPGEYRLAYRLAKAGGEHDLDRGPEPLRLRISGDDRGAGMVQLAHRVRVERNGADVTR